jgi:exodeoxyribonuclease V alpha subunit
MIIVGAISQTVYENGNFSVRRFHTRGAVELPDGNFAYTISIKGDFIPNAYLDVKLEGEFDTKPFINKAGKKSFTFNVTNCEEIKVAEETGIIKYLVSLKGVGSILAKRIFNQFGLKTFEVLDNDIEQLKQVPGIGLQKYNTIAQDYLARGTAKQLYVFLYQYYVSNSKIQRIFNQYRETAIDKIKENPYSFYLRGYFSFDVADRIAKENGHDRLSNERIGASIVEALKRAELSGHTHLDWKSVLFETEKILEVLNRSYESRKKIGVMIRENAHNMLGTYILSDNINGKALLYRKGTAEAERGAAEGIKRLLASDEKFVNYDEDIKEAMEKLGIGLSDEQQDAVKAALNHSVSIVTGGPGTGKTSFQQVLLYVFKKYNNTPIVMGAPTGRAARRMTESSGEPARTLHQILHLVPSEDSDMSDMIPEQINAGLMIVDEMSMVDIFLADKLFSAIQPGTKIVCVGDVCQLPSVGCGEVLFDMINSGAVPVTLFTKVFRQAEGSIIASNAAKINSGDYNVEYGDAFEFIECSSSEEIAEETLKQYEKALKEYGIDETTILTPYRRTTATGVNGLNPKLKGLYNAYPDKNTRTNKLDGLDIYTGDKVMYSKNLDVDGVQLSNGDIGYIDKIEVKDNVQSATVDFKDGRIVTLMGDDLKNLVQAYATTVHKSQGSEYQCCIIIIDPKHSILLRRNLVYTAVTRAKKKVILIGDKEAFKQSVLTEDTNTSGTVPWEPKLERI